MTFDWIKKQQKENAVEKKKQKKREQTINDLKKKHRDINKKMKKIGIKKAQYEENKEEMPK